MFASRFANQKQDETVSLEIRQFERKKDATPLFVPLKSTICTGTVTGPLAHLILTHTFRFKASDCPGPIEAAYRFPLPGDATVLGTTVTFGAHRIETELVEKEDAAKGYRKARKEGHQALWLHRTGADTFTLLLAGLEADTDIIVETAVLLYAKTTEPGWSIRLPLTTAPRYSRDDESERHVFGTGPLALVHDPEHRFRLDLTFTDATNICCPTNAVTSEKTPEGLRVRLSEEEIVPDQDLILEWAQATPSDSSLLSLAIERPEGSPHTTFMATVTPPKEREKSERGIPREVILLVDHSGSMSGAKKAAADWAVRSLLDTLGPCDRFALGTFGSDTEWYRKGLALGTPKEIAGAGRFLDETQADGGTELGMALEQAMSFTTSDSVETARHIIILTDAQVSDGARLLSLAGKARERQHRMVSILCIDSAPNEPLAEALAHEGGGLCEFLTSNPDDHDLTTALEKFLSVFAPPAASGLRLRLEGSALETPEGGPVDEIHLGCLISGRPVVILGRLGCPAGQARLNLIDHRGDILAHHAFSPYSKKSAGLGKLFAARRIRHLEILREMIGEGIDVRSRLETLGLTTPPEPLYAENRGTVLGEFLRKHIVEISLAEGLPSSETSFLAVGDKTGEGIKTSCIVPQAIPRGWEFERDQLAPCLGPIRGRGKKASLTDFLDDNDEEFSFERHGPLNPPPFLASPITRYDAGAERTSSSAPLQGRGLEVLSLYKGCLSPQVTTQILYEGTPEGLKDTHSGSIRVKEIVVKAIDLEELKQWKGGKLVLEVGGDVRLRVSLPDLARRKGKRPLNIRLRRGERICLRFEGPCEIHCRSLELEILLAAAGH